MINRVPSVSSPTILPNPASTSDDLICSYTFIDADGNEDNSMIEWLVDGSIIDIHGSGGSLAANRVSVGDSVTCRVTPNDGLEDGAQVTSPPVGINNGAPVAVVNLVPSEPSTTDAITCTYTLVDPDDDVSSASVRWEINGIPRPSLNNNPNPPPGLFTRRRSLPFRHPK